MNSHSRLRLVPIVSMAVESLPCPRYCETSQDMNSQRVDSSADARRKEETIENKTGEL